MSNASSIPTRVLNPWLLHIQKLSLELKCPICLNLFKRPTLLPCNHILCNVCIPKLSKIGSECQLCRRHYSSQDVRPAPYIEKIVAIYRSLDTTFTTDLLQHCSPDAGKVPRGSPISLNDNADNELKEPAGSPLERNSSNGQSTFQLTSKKRVRASLNCSPNEGNKSTRKSSNSVPPFSSGPGDLTSHLKGAESGTDKRDAIRGMQSSPSNSSDDFKCLDGSAGRSNCVGSDQEEKVRGREDCLQYLKRQKKSDNRLFDGCGSSKECAQPNGSSSERIAASKSESRPGEGWGVEASTSLDPFGTNKNICAFCQSSEITDTTGLMLHYVHGKEVVGDAAMNSNTIHVHKTCVEWTPQAYFVDETVQNLEDEIARAAKLKCSHCGIKGAALGCFMKTCRRTYHVPCAVKISDCRWDTVEFLLLCPMHSKVKFPGEKSKSGKRARDNRHPAPVAITSKKSSSIEVPPTDHKQLLFCGSALSSEEKYQLVKFASHCGAAVTKFWNPNVTHVIASTDSNGAYIRTLKVFKAILYGKWILKTDWIKASMEVMQPVDEEPYEVCQDTYGCCNGPKMGRFRAKENAPKLFDGLNFYFFGDFVPGYKKDLLDLVITAGGAIIKFKEDLVTQNHVGQTTTLVVYNSDLMLEEKDLAGKEKIEAAISFAEGSGCKFIGHTWLLESIASCILKPL